MPFAMKPVSLSRPLAAAVAAAFSLWPLTAAAERTPDYTDPGRWPTMMAFVNLKNAGLTDNAKVDFNRTKTVRLASEKIGPDLYRQVHRIIFTQRAGPPLEVITINNVSREEGSMSEVEVFVVSRRLGKYP